MKIKIRSIEKYLPGEPVSSARLDTQLGAPIGRIEKNTGVSQRYFVKPGDTVCDLGAKALESALESALMKPSELDLLIFAGASFDYPVPNNSAIIKSKITNDETCFPCLDIDSTCLSFINALEIAHLYLLSGKYKRIAIVSSEISSIALSPAEEKTYGLFGDAAVAVILEISENEGYMPGYSNMVNYPSGALLARLPIGGAINRGRESNENDKGYFFQMDGKSLIRLTTKYLDPFVRQLERETEKKIGEFDFIVAHQTSRYGNEYFNKTYKIPPGKLLNTLEEYGNCISASIPLGLEKLFNSSKSSVKENTQVLLIGSAAGLSLGCMVLKF